MFAKLKKIDIFLILAGGMTVLAYFCFQSATYKTFFWLTVLMAFYRLLGIISNRLLWKIRNRLIVSGLFFIVTPIVLITVFFYLIINLVIYQYNTAIFDNLMLNDILSFKESSSYYLNLASSEKISTELQRLKARRPSFLRLVFFKEENGRFNVFFTYPEDFSFKKTNINGPLSGFSSGYFKINGLLYQGLQQIQNGYAALIFESIDQNFFDSLPHIGDFRVLFMGAGGNTLSASLQELSQQLNEKDFAGFDKYYFPIPYTFRFLDYDELKEGKPAVKFNKFFLINDYSKIFKKLKSSDRVSTLERQIQSLQKEIVFTRSSEEIKDKSQQLVELKDELQVLQKRDIQGSILSISDLIRFMLGLFGFFIIVSFIIGFRMVRVITKAINELTRGTEKIRRGDFSYRIRIKSREQMHFLAESFNDMASGIGRLLNEEKEKERLHEELRIARGIQLKLLPPDSFNCPDVDIAAVNIPAQEIAGDYFDYFYQKDEFLSVLVADVSGKGAQAAFYMAELKGIMNFLQKTGKSPATILTECHLSLQNSFEKVTFITVNLVRFDLVEKKFVLSRSGHTPALFYEAASQNCRELTPRGMALGLNNFNHDAIEELHLPYRSGDILFFFSDGLSEIMNAEEKMLGSGSLKKLLIAHSALPAIQIKEKILEFAITFSENKANVDDLTFVVMKVH